MAKQKYPNSLRILLIPAKIGMKYRIWWYKYFTKNIEIILIISKTTIVSELEGINNNFEF